MCVNYIAAMKYWRDSYSNQVDCFFLFHFIFTLNSVFIFKLGNPHIHFQQTYHILCIAIATATENARQNVTYICIRSVGTGYICLYVYEIDSEAAKIEPKTISTRRIKPTRLRKFYTLMCDMHHTNTSAARTPILLSTFKVCVHFYRKRKKTNAIKYV